MSYYNCFKPLNSWLVTLVYILSLGTWFLNLTIKANGIPVCYWKFSTVCHCLLAQRLTKVYDVNCSVKRDIPVYETATQKHLGMFFDFKLNFQEHFENMPNKVNKTNRLLQKLLRIIDNHY